MTSPPRQERAVRTREKILAGAVDVLVEYGYAGMTMQRVQAAAGVSRGALTHHFGSMSEIAVAAVDYIADQQAAEIREAVIADASVDATVQMIHQITRRPTFLAGLQLWLAARAQPELRSALQPGAHRLLGQIREALTPLVGDLPEDQLAVFVDGLLSLLRGLAIGAVLRDRPEREAQVLHAWISAFR
ncbi:putative TetR family transcriptional regulator [Gordonia hirsuta DSM 44140 = NBRC 16056]|uniref:Putative TetR family transcriptional regulator n=1 Tax=Gordonia hirsuta DSM 44140 = NBRC 16056 TaxID=1121927 RepID=L7LC65_9ACTN|nr:TetR/AcrR family transcriptional regulator [Gordonia hirsuta]GAC57628.1 putative TetR family transcriptional regulator [Gordonia hirsuta DSM 44140 = NBRC 16056]